MSGIGGYIREEVRINPGFSTVISGIGKQWTEWSPARFLPGFTPFVPEYFPAWSACVLRYWPQLAVVGCTPQGAISEREALVEGPPG